MNLGELHDEFEFLSGRYDLSDARKTFFINSGQRYLDRLDTIKHSTGKLFKVASVGSWYTTFEGCRAIQAVYVTDDEERWKLEKKELGWLMLEYEDKIAEIDTGDAKYYATPILRTIPQDKSSITLSRFVGETVQVSHKHFGYNGVVWMPPTDAKLIVEVHGLFYSHKFGKSDKDESEWSATYPDILLMAAFRAVEVFYRNTEGVNDWTKAINTEVSTLGMDLVEEDVAEVDQMEG
jgi:hypothetical protein